MKRCKQGASAPSSLNECVSHRPSHGSGQMDRRMVLKPGHGARSTSGERHSRGGLEAQKGVRPTEGSGVGVFRLP